MADIAPENLVNLRTTEDMVNALSTLYFNLNEIERVYYDMFINATPMDITLQRYSDLGTLETITLPNRAKDIQSTKVGKGNPNGAVSAREGALYLDMASLNLYYKGAGTDAYGWVLIKSSLNFSEGEQFLKPDGDGSNVYNLNLNNVGSGVLAVDKGGTGSTGITGLVKGNGRSAYTAAVDGVDYLGPTSFAGIIAYFPVRTIPSGWLRCDGTVYKSANYPTLAGILGNTYGGNGNDTFAVPNLLNYFIRCWDGSSAFNVEQKDQAGAHIHDLSGSIGPESGHTHDRGNMEITGSFPADDSMTVGTHHGLGPTGAFYTGGGIGFDIDSGGGGNGHWLAFAASRSWTGRTGSGSGHTHTLSGTVSENATTGGKETRVLNKMLVPMIKF